MGRLARSPDLHPVGLPWHWNPEFTCGDCAFRKWMTTQSDIERKYSRCRYPRTTSPRVTYGPPVDIVKTWRACIAHKPKDAPAGGTA